MVEGKKVRSMFAGIARRYDFLNHFLSCHIDKVWRRKTVKASQLPANARVLDLCAGTGDLSFAFAKQGARVIGTDFCPEMIQIAQQKKRASQNGLAHTQFAVADTMNLPFAASQFDLVSVAFGIRNLEDWKRGLREMVRVAKPGGKVVILEFTQPKNRFFRAVYTFYFFKVLPRIGSWVSGDSQAYRYLPESVSRFASPEQLVEAMKECGLVQIEKQRLSAGIAVLLLGRKTI